MPTMTNRMRSVKAPNVLEPTHDELADLAAAFAPLSITGPAETADEFHRVNGYGNRARVAYAASATPFEDQIAEDWMRQLDPAWSFLPQIDGSGLSPEEFGKITHLAAKVRAQYRHDAPEATADELERIENAARRDALRLVLKSRPAASIVENATDDAPCCSPDEAAPCAACVNSSDANDTDDEDDEDVDTDALEAKHRQLMPDYFDARDVQDAIETEEWKRKQAIPRFKTTDDFGEVDFTAGHEWTLARVIEMLLERIARGPDQFTSEWAVWSGRSLAAFIRKRPDGSPFVVLLDETDDPALWDLTASEDIADEQPQRVPDEWRAALDESHRRQDERREAKRSIPAFRITDDTGDCRFEAEAGLTLERVIKEELDRLTRNPRSFDAERVIWQDNLVMAVIGKREDGSPYAVRLDEYIDADEVGGVGSNETLEADEEPEAATLTLPELIEHEVARMRRMETGAGDLMAHALADLARVVRLVSAARPDQVGERLALLARDYSDPIDCEPELTPAGRFA